MGLVMRGICDSYETSVYLDEKRTYLRIEDHAYQF